MKDHRRNRKRLLLRLQISATQVDACTQTRQRHPGCVSVNVPCDSSAFSASLLSLRCPETMNITALTRANQDEAGICIISPTKRTSPPPDALRASPVGAAQFPV